MKSLNCSMKRIKDKREKDYLHASANIDFFLSMEKKDKGKGKEESSIYS